ncbi:MAG: hypothetical protein ABSG78_21840 [Verrucomicrobiota bacterium]|jgi:alpha-tubulin suppressor-like RCC1 family protein
MKKAMSLCGSLFLAVLFIIATPADAQSLGAALNATNLTWTTSSTGSASGWSVETTTTEDGVSAAQSGSVSGASASFLQTHVTGPGTLTFWWYASSPSGEEILSFNVGGVTQANTSSPMSSWQQQTLYLGYGPQTLQWVYSQFMPPGDGRLGYVDEVAYTPGLTAPIVTSQPVSQSAVSGLNSTFSISVTGTPPFYYQWQFDGTNIAGATSPAYTVINVQATNLGSYSVTVTNAAGTNYSANATLEFGNVAAWGLCNFAQTEVAPGTTNVLSMAGGWQHSLALRADGTILAWGSNGFGQETIPVNLTGVVAIGAGQVNSLVLNADGTVFEWGQDSNGQTNVPASVTNAVAIATSPYAAHSLALKADGTVSAWGNNTFGQTNVPAMVTNAVAVAAGQNHSLALRSDGTVIAWGMNMYGQTNVPPGLTNVVAIAAGGLQSLALKSDGTVEGWGAYTAAPVGLSNAVAVAAGNLHCLVLKADGTVVAWGNNQNGQTNVPAGLTNVVAIAAGAFHNLALVGNGPPVLNALITNFNLSGGGFSLALPSQCGRVYALEYKSSLTDANWSALPLAAGNGTNLVLTDPTISNAARFYRVRRW